jgi:hypothetical protein
MSCSLVGLFQLRYVQLYFVAVGLQSGSIFVEKYHSGPFLQRVFDHGKHVP